MRKSDQQHQQIAYIAGALMWDRDVWGEDATQFKLRPLDKYLKFAHIAWAARLQKPRKGSLNVEDEWGERFGT